jgi:Mn-containing catalase
MYHHVKKLMFTVRVDEPDPRFGNMLLEQFGGANGELAAAMQYSIQGLNCEDPDRKDLLMDIGTEELSHLEIVGTLARMHLKPMKFDRQAAEADPLIAIAGGGGVNLFNSQGNAWTADYLKITGELDVDLRSYIAAEARAKIVYERLINFCDDAGTKDALQFLMTREITHMKAFALALESMSKPAFSIGRIAPTPGLVDQFFNDSTGTGEHGEIDTRGPWNEGNGWVFTESPAIQAEPGAASALVTESSPPADEAGLYDRLIDELRDILHADKQLTRALPRMAEAARFDQLRVLFERHLVETEIQVERINECVDRRRGRSALDPLLLAIDGGFDAGGCARIFPRDFAERGAGGFLFLQRRQRLAEPQQGVGRLARLVELGGHVEECLGGVPILLALEVAFAKPVLRIRDQGIARIFLRKILHRLFGQRIVLALHVADAEIEFVL